MDGDLVTIFESNVNTLNEMEAREIQAVLEASGIPSMLVGDPVLPNLGFAVRVAAERAEEARAVIAEALAWGAEAAEPGEQESEAGTSGNG